MDTVGRVRSEETVTAIVPARDFPRKFDSVSVMKYVVRLRRFLGTVTGLVMAVLVLK
jgi:hypothetical protein